MHHAAAAELDPPGLLAHRAAGAVALPAAEVDFRARLRVRKKLGRNRTRDGRARTSAARTRAACLSDRASERPSPTARPSICAERGRVGQVEIVAPIDAPGHDDADRRLCAPACSGSASTRCASAAASADRRRDRRRRWATRGRACPACRARDAPPACSARRSSATRLRPPGPSTTVKPMRGEDRLPGRSRTIVSGWRRPSGRTPAGQRDVDRARWPRAARRRVAGYARPARLDRLLQLVGEPADARVSGPAARRAIACIHDGDDAVLAAEIAVADRTAPRAADVACGELGSNARRCCRDGVRLGRRIISEVVKWHDARSDRSESRNVLGRVLYVSCCGRCLCARRAFAAPWPARASFANAAGLGDGELRQALAIERDAGVLQAADELPVGQAVLARARR